MSFYVLARPDGHASAALVEQTPGQPNLIAEVGDAQIAVQAADHPEGLKLAAGFAWNLAKAATEFATRCQELAMAQDSDAHGRRSRSVG
ncbi:hypothetical protein GCM10022243_19490 [Saccharothrix violaceirubra]|uniref:Uncharacterized protein n=1 Tax=Saccharothrix violaceirubra TaxID=413306 RepID=A0A7W7T225_9PSEU|nr:hypothetical protein [Saccharothrix violaceirubra]MBB4965144.1 hypothetical protein [Saccharothrix violaceirubra]